MAHTFIVISVTSGDYNGTHGDEVDDSKANTLVSADLLLLTLLYFSLITPKYPNIPYWLGGHGTNGYVSLRGD
eukprot:scaffold145061_cov22-Prasinocladus_malaysianus.AAC.1